MSSDIRPRQAPITEIVESVPALKRGQVWCTVCGHTGRVDSADAMRRGWPKHCGYTMTIDSPEEREHFRRILGLLTLRMSNDPTVDQ